MSAPGPRRERVPCPRCGRKLADGWGVNVHLKRVHGVPSWLVRDVRAAAVL